MTRGTNLPTDRFLIKRRECPMCHLCEAIDEKIARYRRLANQVSDKQTLDSIDILIAKLEARKKALHPEKT